MSCNSVESFKAVMSRQGDFIEKSFKEVVKSYPLISSGNKSRLSSRRDSLVEELKSSEKKRPISPPLTPVVKLHTQETAVTQIESKSVSEKGSNSGLIQQ